MRVIPMFLLLSFAVSCGGPDRIISNGPRDQDASGPAEPGVPGVATGEKKGDWIITTIPLREKQKSNRAPTTREELDKYSAGPPTPGTPIYPTRK